MGSEEQDKKQWGQRDGSVQGARVSFLPAATRSGLHLASSLQPFPPESRGKAGAPSSRTPAVLPTSAQKFQEAEKSDKRSAEDVDVPSAWGILPTPC